MLENWLFLKDFGLKNVSLHGLLTFSTYFFFYYSIKVF